MKELVMPVCAVFFVVCIIIHSTASVDITVLRQHDFCTKKATRIYWISAVGGIVAVLFFIVEIIK